MHKYIIKRLLDLYVYFVATHYFGGKLVGSAKTIPPHKYTSPNCQRSKDFKFKFISSIFWYNLMKFDTLIHELSSNIHQKIYDLIRSDNARISTNTSLGWLSKVNTIQYLVWPPADGITARQRRLTGR